MNQDQTEQVRAAADRIAEMAEELEASSDITVDGSKVERMRALLHAWIDEMTAVVSSPALGRVTIIHPNGKESTISSPDLPFRLSRPNPE